jgi:hypothetical protein
MQFSLESKLSPPMPSPLGGEGKKYLKGFRGWKGDMAQGEQTQAGVKQWAEKVDNRDFEDVPFCTPPRNEPSTKFCY